MEREREYEPNDKQKIKALGLQPPPEVRWLGWVPGGSNHLLRRWARSPREATEQNITTTSCIGRVEVQWASNGNRKPSNETNTKPPRPQQVRPPNQRPPNQNEQPVFFPNPKRPKASQGGFSSFAHSSSNERPAWRDGRIDAAAGHGCHG